MSLSVGIVGLPNAGKSTLFNALAGRRLAPTAAHPFTTIQPHIAVVPVPDDRFTRLVATIRPEKETPATVMFIDVAGLVKGAHTGEGLGNQFLANIRQVDAIVHVVRTFSNRNVPHVHEGIDPEKDIDVVRHELAEAGIEKPVIYVLNGDEDIKAHAHGRRRPSLRPLVTLSAKLEEDMADIPAEERAGYRRELKLGASSLDELIQAAYALLGHITFYTIKGGREVRAISVRHGTPIIEAAAKVHTDFAKHFIKAVVISVETLLSSGSWREAKEQGKLKTAGRDDVVQDGDVIEFMVH